jgi:CDP-diacylglycerol---serine O-phosphatidyltransferase
MRKIYLVPNFVTTANLFCGFYAIIAAIQSDFTVAAWAILAAGVFDLLDGRIARMAKATSEFGGEYDSMSDLVSFGLAPALVLFLWALQPFGRIGWMASFIFVACGALRLARFNVSTGVVPKAYFQGLPIPMAAGIVSTFVIFNKATGWLDQGMGSVALGIAVVLSILMVSSIPFPSFKELNWRSSASFGYLLVGVLIMVLIAARPEVTIFLLLTGYVLFSLVLYLVGLVRKQGSSAKVSKLSEHPKT